MNGKAAFAAAFLFYLPSRPSAPEHKVKNEMKIEGSGRGACLRDGMGKRAAFTLILCGVLVILAVSSAVSVSMMYVLSGQNSRSVPTKEQVTEHMNKEIYKHTAIYYTADEAALGSDQAYAGPRKAYQSNHCRLQRCSAT